MMAPTSDRVSPFMSHDGGRAVTTHCATRGHVLPSPLRSDRLPASVLIDEGAGHAADGHDHRSPAGFARPGRCPRLTIVSPLFTVPGADVAAPPLLRYCPPVTVIVAAALMPDTVIALEVTTLPSVAFNAGVNENGSGVVSTAAAPVPVSDAVCGLSARVVHHGQRAGARAGLRGREDDVDVAGARRAAGSIRSCWSAIVARCGDAA